jgi:glycosyltransferase involved in cell wall biosynthesis
MRIGVNALYLIPGGVGGTEIYLRNLLRALAAIDRSNHYVVFTNRETGEVIVPEGWVCERTPVRARIRPARILWEQAVLPVAVRRAGLDVLLNAGFTAPVLARCPQVTMIHDLQYKRRPELFRWYDLPFWRSLVYASVKRSRLLLANSEATRDDLLHFFRLPAERVRLTPLGVEEEFFKLTRRPEPFLLTVSTLHPHKNLDRLLRAFAHFRKRHPDFRLVIAGLRGFAAAELQRQRDSTGLHDAAEFTGWIPRERLYDLYERAWAFIYPSTFEGFGLPVLEALAAGVPCACSGIEPLRSVAGGAALHFDPRREEDIRTALERIAFDEALRTSLAAAGPPRAAQFSWETTADRTLRALTDAAAQKP